MSPAISFESVSKKFSRHPDKRGRHTLSDLLSELAGRHRKWAIREDEFLALDEISFEVNQGETFGLIGRNGAGKTTILKLLNGTTKPDRGRIVVEGSVQALINLGAGLSARLTGRENIFNSAAISGFSNRQTKQIFDEIVDFAELESVVDSPLETYSSGMKARLGFSIAVNLRPDVLLIDEILAVGDFAFKNKCFIKMQELKKNGVTIVFVSHSHTHIIQLCERTLWIHRGKLLELGPAKQVVQNYLDFQTDNERAQQQTAAALKKNSASKEGLYGPICPASDALEIVDVKLIARGNETDTVYVHDEVIIEYTLDLKRPVSDMNITLSFLRKDGVRLSSLSTLNGDALGSIQSGKFRCRTVIPDFNLNPGAYVLLMPVHEGKSYLFRDVVKEFYVKSNGRMTWDYVDLDYEIEVQIFPT